MSSTTTRRQRTRSCYRSTQSKQRSSYPMLPHTGRGSSSLLSSGEVFYGAIY
jgi:hypothetical protein